MNKRIPCLKDLVYGTPYLIKVDKESKLKLKLKGKSCFLYLCKYYGNKGYVSFPKYLHKRIKKREESTIFLHIYYPKGESINVSKKEYLRNATCEFLSEKDFNEKKEEYYIKDMTSNNICY